MKTASLSISLLLPPSSLSLSLFLFLPYHLSFPNSPLYLFLSHPPSILPYLFLSLPVSLPPSFSSSLLLPLSLPPLSTFLAFTHSYSSSK